MLLILLLVLVAIPSHYYNVLAQDSSTTTTRATTATTRTNLLVGGIQTHFDDVSFAGGMDYDTENDVLYITGQVGPSSCYVGVLKRIVDGTGSSSSSSSSSSRSSFRLLSKQVFTPSAVGHAIALRKDQTGSTLVLTTMEEGGLLTETREVGSQKAQQYGGIIELQFTPDGTDSLYRTDHSVLMHQDVVQIPRSVTMDPVHPNLIFVVAMTSESSSIQSEFSQLPENEIPNLTPGGAVTKYGHSYAMTVECVRLATDFASAEQQWRKPFGVVGDESNTGVRVNQILYHGSRLYIVGSTSGSGKAFGQATARPDSAEIVNDGEQAGSSSSNYMAGFITMLDPRSGDIHTVKRYTVQDNGDHDDFDSTSGTTAAVEGEDTDTYIEAICVTATTNDDDVDENNVIYIVGSYTVSGRAIPFLTKLDASTLETLWHVKLPATTSARSLACGVDTTIDAIYVAGVVQDGGELLGQTTTHLQDDVFVVQLSGSDGALHWIRQLGTSGNDRLAGGGSGLVVLGNGGGVLLMGDTTGNLYSTSTHTNEVFVLTVDAAGQLPETTESTGKESINYNTAIARPVNVDLNDDGGETDGGTGGDANTEGTDQSTSEDPNNNTASEGVSFNALPVAAVAFAIILLSILSIGYIKSKRKQEQITERSLVFSYLQAFDVEDVDVRHSATGGWHGTYVGKLAQGVNAHTGRPDNVEDGDRGDPGNSALLSSYSHSSIIKDSLFVDYDSTPTYGDEDDQLTHRTYSSDRRQTDDKEEFNIASLSYKDRIENLDPWGKEIV